MTRRIVEWMHKARRLESAISATVEGATRPAAGLSPRQPLEILHAIVALAEREVIPSGRGQHAFPFTHIRVTLLAPSPRDRARLEVACGGPPTLEQRILERLAASGCVTEGVTVVTSYATEAAADWTQPEFLLDFSREPVAPAPDVARPAPGRLDLAVTHGTAEHSHYSFSADVITIGRGAEVRDARDRLLRTNLVAFAEDGTPVNLSVSRRHAHVTREAATGGFRLHDESGQQQTSVIRDGRGVPVPRGRGLRLRSGDVIVLGQARIGVTLPA